jgi:hypothetical protein
MSNSLRIATRATPEAQTAGDVDAAPMLLTAGNLVREWAKANAPRQDSPKTEPGR